MIMKIVAGKKNYKDTNNIEFYNNPNTKLKMFQISPTHFRDSSGGRHNYKNIPIINKLNYFGSLSSKNKINNSKEKKYINKTKNIIYNNLHNSNNKNYLEMMKIRKIFTKNKNSNTNTKPMVGEKIKFNNINNNNIKNNVNEENVTENDNKDMILN